MKKLLFLLLATVAMYGQVPADATPLENIQITNNIQDNTATKVTVQTSLGVQNWLPMINLPISTAAQTALDLKKNTTSTAITSTLTITNNTTSVTVSSFTGKIVNNSTVPATITNISFSGAINVVPLYFRTILYVDNTGTLQQFNGSTSDLSPLQRVDNLFVGIVVFSGGTVLVVQTLPDIEYATDNRLALLGNYIRNINEGNNIGANGANLQVNKGSGTTWRLGSNFATDRKVPDVTTDIAATPIPSGVNLIGYRNGSGGWTYEAYSGSLTPTFWDDGTGVKATVANNKFTNQRVYFFNGTNTYVIYLGRAEHATLAAAVLEAEKPNSIVDPSTSVSSLIGTVSVEKSCTALNNTTLAAFTQGPRMQGGASSGGTSGTQNLQSTYLNSLQPQITTTTTLGALDVQRGSAADTDAVFRAKNGAGTVTAGIAGNGAITGLSYNGYSPENVANKATDFTTVNNTLYPTVQAVKTYADGLVVGLLDDRGSYNASSNVFPSTGGSGTSGAILKGDIWYVSVAGTLGGKAVAIGDSFRAIADTPGQTAGNWSLLSSNLGYVPANDANVIHTTGTESKTGTLTVTGAIGSDNGLSGISTTSHGVLGTSTSGKGVGGFSSSDSGVLGQSTTGLGLQAVTISGSKIASFQEGATERAYVANTGAIFSVTATAGQSDTQLASTAFVTTADNLKANIASPTFTGVVTSPSFVKSGATAGNILLAGGTDIAQSTFPLANGTGATGTWGINVSGNAATATNSTDWGGVTLNGVSSSTSIDYFFGYKSSLDTGHLLTIADTKTALGLSSAVTGTGTTNFLPKFTGSSTVGNSAWQESTTGGRLFDTTDDGVNKLQVNGGVATTTPTSAFFTSKTTVSGATQTLEIYNSSNTRRMLFGYGNTSSDKLTLSNDLNGDVSIGTNSIERINIASNGVVKINNLSGTGTRTVVADASGNLSTLVRPLVYTALLTQTSTNAPVATVLENTLGGTVVWTRTATGTYIGTLTGAFPTTKTTTFIQHTMGTSEKEATYIGAKNVDFVAIHTHSDLTTTTLNDDVLLSTSLEIRVYP